MLARHLAPVVDRALTDTPAVMVAGPRQVGKTTLIRGIRPAAYVTLDLAVPRSAARADPEAFLSGLPDVVAIDEVQRVPELLLALKATIDADPRPGRYLLSGSADILSMPRVADALPGRMEILTLWPFTQGEIDGRVDGFVDALFEPALPEWTQPERTAEGTSAPTGHRDLLDRVLRGGFPAAVSRSGERREAWFEAYLTAVLSREAMDLTAINDPADLIAMIRLIAARNASLLNLADVARDANLAHSTARRYLRLLETLFLVVEVPAWSTNLTSRTVRAPKMTLCDSGLVAHVLGLDRQRLRADPVLAGSLLEGFVAMEVRKQLVWSRARPRLYHYRDRSTEVDLVLERRDGRLAGVEVKAGRAVRSDDFRGLRAFADLAGERFVRGVVLYGGDEAVAFGPNLWALPVSALWC